MKHSASKKQPCARHQNQTLLVVRHLLWDLEPSVPNTQNLETIVRNSLMKSSITDLY